MSNTSLPAWARLLQEPVEMVAGRDFCPGDTLYLSNTAYPRVLWTKLSDTLWSALVQRDGRHQRGQVNIEPDVQYVVKRATPRKAVAPLPGMSPENFFLDRPLTQIRADGEFLEVGDVLWLDHIRGRAEILDISAMKLEGGSHVRKARLDFLNLKKVEPYTFTGFHLQMFKLIAGPKFTAAQRDPACVVWMQGPNYWRWKGSK